MNDIDIHDQLIKMSICGMKLCKTTLILQRMYHLSRHYSHVLTWIIICSMVPVLATGFGDVLKRMEMQDIQLDAHKKTMMVRMMMHDSGRVKNDTCNRKLESD